METTGDIKLEQEMSTVALLVYFADCAVGGIRNDIFIHFYHSKNLFGTSLFSAPQLTPDLYTYVPVLSISFILQFL